MLTIITEMANAINSGNDEWIATITNGTPEDMKNFWGTSGRLGEIDFKAFRSPRGWILSSGRGMHTCVVKQATKGWVLADCDFNDGY